MNKRKFKTVKIKLNELEMDAIEDVFFCDLSEKQYAEVRPLLVKVWQKLCKEMDYHSWENYVGSDKGKKLYSHEDLKEDIKRSYLKKLVKIKKQKGIPFKNIKELKKRVKEIVNKGGRAILLEKYMKKYADGECDIGTIAKKTGLPYTKVMDELAKAKIPINDMTIEELQEEMKTLKEK